jgi:hypothetical protein
MQGRHAEADVGHPAVGKVVEPRAHQLVVRSRSRPVAAIAGPSLGVLGRVLDLALHDVRVQASPLQPALPHLAPVLAGGQFPVPKKVRDAAGVQVLAYISRQFRHDRVAGAAAVAILVRREARAARGDRHSRRAPR